MTSAEDYRIAVTSTSLMLDASIITTRICSWRSNTFESFASFTLSNCAILITDLSNWSAFEKFSDASKRRILHPGISCAMGNRFTLRYTIVPGNRPNTAVVGNALFFSSQSRERTTLTMTPDCSRDRRGTQDGHCY